MSSMTDDRIADIAMEISARPEQVAAVIPWLDDETPEALAYIDASGLDGEQLRWIKARLAVRGEEGKRKHDRSDHHREDTANHPFPAGGWRIKQKKPAEQASRGRDRSNPANRRAPKSSLADKEPTFSQQAEAPHYFRSSGQAGAVTNDGRKAPRPNRRLATPNKRAGRRNSRMMRVLALTGGAALGVLVTLVLVFNGTSLPLLGDRESTQQLEGVSPHWSLSYRTGDADPDDTSLVDQLITSAAASGFTGDAERQRAAAALEALAATSRPAEK